MHQVNLTAGDILYDLNVSGSVTWSRAFEDHPKLTGAGLLIYAQEYAAIKAGLIKGETVQALGRSWRVASLDITEDLQRPNTYRLSFELVGELSPADSEIKTRLHPLDEPTDIAGMLNKGVLTLSDLVTYTGLDPYRIPFGIPDEELRITPRELLEKYKRRLSANGGFIFWSGSQPEFRDWGRTTVHDVSAIYNEAVDISEPGQGAVVDGVQLVAEAVHLEFVPDDSVEFKYDECLTKVEEPPNGAENVLRSEFPDLVQMFKSAGVWFDSGGLVKERVTTKQCNGKPVEIRTERYGFVGSSNGGYGNTPRSPLNYVKTHSIQRDVIPPEDPEGDPEIIYTKVYNLGLAASLLPSVYWAKVYDVTEFFVWDDQNYLRETYKSGWEVFRFKQEGDSLEALETYIAEYQAQDALDAHIEDQPDPVTDEWIAKLNELRAALQKARDVGAKQRVAYMAFHTIDYDRSNSYTRYEFDSLGNYYRDIRATTSNPYKYCRKEIQVRDWMRTMLDPEYDPRAIPESGKSVSYLTVGERYRMERTVRIDIPASRADQRTIQVFKEGKRESNAEGNAFKDRIVISPVTTNEGRPSEHERREYYGWTKGDLEDELGFSIDDIEGQKTVLLNTPGTGYGAGDPPRGEWSSAGVRTIEEARPAMSLEYSIENTQGARTTSFTIDADPAIEEGDVLRCAGEKWVVLGLETQYELSRGVALAHTSEASVGRVIAFDGLWLYIYPNATEYPPNLAFPGSPPSTSSTLVSYLTATNRLVATIRSNTVASLVDAPERTNAASLNIVGGTVASEEFFVQRTAPALLNVVGGTVVAQTIYEDRQVVIRRDVNWGPHPYFGVYSQVWSSIANGQEFATGSMDFGYFKRGNATKLWMVLGGYGATRGNLKLVEVRREDGDGVVFATGLNTLVPVDSLDALRWAYIPLDIGGLLGADELFYLRFTDNDGSSNSAWFSVVLDSFILEV